MTRLLLILSLCLTAHAAEGRWITVEATAYCGGPCTTCETIGVTANGTQTTSRPYGVAASRNIPMGSRVYVPRGAGYLDRLVPGPDGRWWPVDDRGGALDVERRRSGLTRLDLRYKSHASAQQFGRKLILVFITSDN